LVVFVVTPSMIAGSVLGGFGVMYFADNER